MKGVMQKVQRFGGAMFTPVLLLELKASYINPLTQKRALDLIDSGRLDVSSMVAQVCGLEKLEEILANPEARAKGKYIISPEM